MQRAAEAAAGSARAGDVDPHRAAARASCSCTCKAGDAGYWVGFPLPPRPADDDIPWRAVAWALIVVALLLVAAFAFARYLARPLRELEAAVERVGRGETPPPLPESGPSEIARSIAASTR